MDKKKSVILAILAVIGIIITLDLCYIFFKVNFELSAAPSFCSVNSFVDCDGVAQTKYSVFFGVPLAMWGLILYSTMLFLLATPFINKKFPNTIIEVFKNPASYIAILALVSFLISMSLAGISILTINKICVLCFATYFLDLIIAFVAKEKGSFFKNDAINTVKDFIEGAKKYFILFIAVVVAGVGVLYYLSTSYVLAPNIKKQESYEEFRKLEKNVWGVQGNKLGNPDGKVRIFIYGDFMCPFCKIANMMAHKLAKEYKEVYVTHINYPLDASCNRDIPHTVHPHACILARYAIAAKKQGNYWGMINAIYDNYPSNEKELLELAKGINLDTQKLDQDAHSADVGEELGMQINFTSASGIVATPSFTINGINYIGAMPYFELVERAHQAFKRQERENEQ